MNRNKTEKENSRASAIRHLIKGSQELFTQVAWIARCAGQRLRYAHQTVNLQDLGFLGGRGREFSTYEDGALHQRNSQLSLFLLVYQIPPGIECGLALSGDMYGHCENAELRLGWVYFNRGG